MANFQPTIRSGKAANVCWFYGRARSNFVDDVDDLLLPQICKKEEQIYFEKKGLALATGDLFRLCRLQFGCGGSTVKTICEDSNEECKK